jgi:hypothetical protein
VRDISCPVCDADLPLRGDERPGEPVFCSYCRAPLVLRPGGEEDEVEAEEDF